jgi:DNA-binding MarR family transcriptional regulator
MEHGNMTPDKKLALLLWDVSRLLRKHIDARTDELGLTSARWHVLSTVARCEKLNQAPLNQAALAEMLDIEPITLSRQIDKLTEAGLIERRADPSDRRAHLLHLTESAWPLVMAFREIATGVLSDALAGLGKREIDGLIASLEQVRGNLTGKAESPKVATRTKSNTEESLSQ